MLTKDFSELMTDLPNQWLQYLAQQGARFGADTPANLLGFGDDASNSLPASEFIAPLCDLGLIEASGEDAANFLHNQLTNDVEHLVSGEARLGGYCTPKGRLLATFLYWRTDHAIMLQLPREIQASVQKRLQMFVLRARAKLRDASDEFVMFGLSGQTVSQVLAPWFPQIPQNSYEKLESEAGTLIRLPDASGSPRFQWVTHCALAIEAWPQLAAALRAVGPNAWRLSEIHAGIPVITRATQEQFVPQMVNYELINGVNFKKGCYPGQEIVARSQYLGKLKRRMLLASVAGEQVQAGMEIFAADEPEQPCGMIVNAEVSTSGETDCLVEIKVAAATNTSVRAGTASGPALRFKALPYPLPDRDE